MLTCSFEGACTFTIQFFKSAFVKAGLATEGKTPSAALKILNFAFTSAEAAAHKVQTPAALKTCNWGAPAPSFAVAPMLLTIICFII